MEIKINIFDLEWLKSILLDVMPTSQITFVSGNSQDNVTVKIVHTIKKTTKVTKYASVADTKLLLIGESFIAFQDFISIKH